MHTYNVVADVAACAVEKLKTFKEVVVAGGAVAPEGLLGRIKKAKKLVFVNDLDGNLVAVGGLKQPKESYVEKMFDKANCEMQDPALFGLELGWIAVKPEAKDQGIVKGIISTLLHNLQGADGRVYATCYADGEIARALTDAGFARIGMPFMSGRDDRTLNLFIQR